MENRTFSLEDAEKIFDFGMLVQRTLNDTVALPSKRFKEFLESLRSPTPKTVKLQSGFSLEDMKNAIFKAHLLGQEDNYNLTDEKVNKIIKSIKEFIPENTFSLEDMRNILNIGMSLRQDQLNGYRGKSGEEKLQEYILSVKK